MLSLVERAESLARRVHSRQYRRDGVTPYVTHLETVVAILKEWTAQDYVLAAAWLHDSVEDGCIKHEELKEEFKNDLSVPLYVKLLTHQPNDTYEQYIDSFKDVPIHVVRIKIADILANIGDRPSQKQTLKYAKALRVLMPMIMKQKE